MGGGGNCWNDNRVPLGQRGWPLGVDNNAKHVTSQYPERKADSGGDGKHKLGHVFYKTCFFINNLIIYNTNVILGKSNYGINDIFLSR